jgi:protein-S-isoprenylcysteine O-methyltransferase Ste14
VDPPAQVNPCVDARPHRRFVLFLVELEAKGDKVLRIVFWVFQGSVLAWLAAEVFLQVRQYRQGGKVRSVEWASFGVIVLSILVGNVLAKEAAANLRALHIAAPYPDLLALATVVLWVGAGFRLWAIHSLGRYFRGVVHVQEGHQVIRTGPYRYLRHPSYSGALLAVLGIGLVWANVAAWAVFFGCALLGVLYRIRVEERVLVDGLGAEYVDYAAQTKRLVPGVW